MAKSGQQDVPTEEDAKQAGRQSAVDLMLALLIAEIASKEGNPGSLPDRIEHSLDKMASLFTMGVHHHFQDAALVRALDDAFGERIDGILDIARSSLARHRRIDPDE